MLTILEYLWAIFFVGLLSVCGLVATYAIVEFLYRVIQMFLPNFGKRFVTPEPERERTQVTHQAAKKIAFDYLLEQARQRRQVATVSQTEFGRFKDLVEARLQGRLTAITVGKTTAEENKNGEEWDLNLLNQAIPIEIKKINRADAELKDKAQFSLVTFPEGPKGPPRYLCMKLNSASSVLGKSLRVAFADLPQMAIRLDHESAHRLAKMIPNTFVAPINAAGRRWIRGEGGKQEAGNAKHATA